SFESRPARLASGERKRKEKLAGSKMGRPRAASNQRNRLQAAAGRRRGGGRPFAKAGGGAASGEGACGAELAVDRTGGLAATERRLYRPRFRHLAPGCRRGLARYCFMGG